MCVIAFAPEGVDLPSETMRAEMWDANPDGFGMMYVFKGRVYIEKGFMDYKTAENAIAGIEKKLKSKNLTPKDIPFLLHYRITTHGGTTPGLTHPFPVTSHNDMLQALDLYTDVGVAHNGIIYSVTAKNSVSDTMQYIKDVMLPLYRSNPEFFMDENIQDLLTNTIDGSRLAILDRKGQHVLLGKWDTLETAPGVLFSNTLFDFKPVYNYGHTYGKRKTRKVRAKKVPGNVDASLVKYTGVGAGEAVDQFNVWDITDESYKIYYVDVLGGIFHDSYYSKNTYTEEAYFDEICYIGPDKQYHMLNADDELLKDVEFETITVTYYDA